MIYPKIDTLFERDKTSHKLVEPLVFKNPVYDQFKRFHFTEKIHGMNIRIILNDDKSVIYAGRSDAAVLPGDLLKLLEEKFTQEKLIETFWKRDIEPGAEYKPFKVVIFGEGYGAGIQEGGSMLNPAKAFRMFDVAVMDRFLNWNAVEEIAKKFDVKTVPVIGEFPLDVAVDMVKKGIVSAVADEEGTPGHTAEGLVGRTLAPLFDAKGDRVILKLKTEDFA